MISLKALPPILIVVLSCVALPVLALPPTADGMVAAVFPPTWSDAEVMAAAASAGRIVRPGGVGFVMVVALDEGGAETLRHAGALFQFNPRLIGCGPGSGPAAVTELKSASNIYDAF
jgi:hypothetical protein